MTCPLESFTSYHHFDVYVVIRNYCHLGQNVYNIITYNTMLELSPAILAFLLVCVWVSHSVVRPHGLQPTRFLYPWDFPGKDIGMGCHFLLQGIFLTQGSNPGLLHYRQILYHLNYEGQLPSFLPRNYPRVITQTQSITTKLQLTSATEILDKQNYQ